MTDDRLCDTPTAMLLLGCWLLGMVAAWWWAER